jgi:hypothetical protein
VAQYHTGFLFGQRGHHRITVDPAAASDQAIGSYAKVGFRAVGVMRKYGCGGDGRFPDGLLIDLLRGELADDRVRIVRRRGYCSCRRPHSPRTTAGRTRPRGKSSGNDVRLWPRSVLRAVFAGYCLRLNGRDWLRSGRDNTLALRSEALRGRRVLRIRVCANCEVY